MNLVLDHSSIVVSLFFLLLLRVYPSYFKYRKSWLCMLWSLLADSTRVPRLSARSSLDSESTEGSYFNCRKSWLPAISSSSLS